MMLQSKKSDRVIIGQSLKLICKWLSYTFDWPVFTDIQLI